MAENSSNSLLDLGLLQILRKSMQEYQQLGPKCSESVRHNIIDIAYSQLPDDIRMAKKEAIIEQVKSMMTRDSFDLREFEQKAERNKVEVKKEAKVIKIAKAQQKQMKDLEKQIKEELQYKKGVDPQAKLLSVRVLKDGDRPKKYEINLEGVSEPVLINISYWPAKKRFVTPCSMLNSRAGVSKSSLDMLVSLNEQAFCFEDSVSVSPQKKNTSDKEYRKLVGLGAKDNLTRQQQKEAEIYNLLGDDDKKSMGNLLKIRTIKQQKYKEVIENLDKCKKSSGFNIGRIFAITGENIAADDYKKFEDALICDIAQDKEYVFNKLAKKMVDEKGKERPYTPYEALRNRIINRHGNSFNEVFNFELKPEPDMATMRKKLKQLFSDINPRTNAAAGMLNSVTAEIMAVGIFNKAIRLQENASKSSLATGESRDISSNLKKMNLLLNELGVNIRFGEHEVVKAPDDASIGVKGQEAIDRQEFFMVKSSDFMRADKAKFEEDLNNRYQISATDADEVHHFVPLKYNAFVKENLNDKTNFVRTTRINPWNLDLHALVHTFDTGGEFLVRDADGNMKLSTFKKIAENYHRGRAQTIMAPNLQLLDEKGKFVDVMTHPADENARRLAVSISDNDTITSFAKVPAYFLNETLHNKKSKVLSD